MTLSRGNIGIRTMKVAQCLLLCVASLFCLNVQADEQPNVFNAAGEQLLPDAPAKVTAKAAETHRTVEQWIEYATTEKKAADRIAAANTVLAIAELYIKHKNNLPESERNIIRAAAVSFIGSKDEQQRMAGVRILQQIGRSDCVETLAALLQSEKSAAIRVEAANTLGRLQFPGSVDPLRSVLLNKKETKDVKLAATSALKAFGDDEAKAAIEEGLKATRDRALYAQMLKAKPTPR